MTVIYAMAISDHSQQYLKKRHYQLQNDFKGSNLLIDLFSMQINIV